MYESGKVNHNIVGTKRKVKICNVERHIYRFIQTLKICTVIVNMIF